MVIIKYGCFAINEYDIFPIKESNVQNLFVPNNIVDNWLLYHTTENDVDTFYFRHAAGAKFSGFIKVEPSHNYFMPNIQKSSYLGDLYLFDVHRNYLGVISRYLNGPILTVPSNCYFVAFNVNSSSNELLFDSIDSIYFVDTKCGISTLQQEIGKDSDVKMSNLNFLQMEISGIFEDNIALYYGQYAGTIFYSDKGWSVPFTKYSVATLLGSNYKISYVVFFKHSTGGGSYNIRTLIFTEDNKLFASTTGTFEGFQEANIWDMYGHKYWNADPTDKDPSGTRYRFHFPSDIATRQNAFLWHNGPVWLSGQGGQFGMGLMFANYSDANDKDADAGAQLYYTEDGVNIYVQYQFGVHQKYYKIADDENVHTAVFDGYTRGDALDTTDFSGSYTSGLSIKRRYNIIPSETTPDPSTLFEYGSPIDVTAISGQVFTLQSATGLNVGDVVIFTGSASGDYAKIINTSYSASIGGESAFVITDIDGNDIKLADVIGNVDNNLMCRHLHGISEFGEGIVMFTGEEYPYGWEVFIMPYMQGVSGNQDNALWRNSVVRLNSSPNSFQRLLGTYLRSDGKMVLITDSSKPYDKKLSVRNQDIIMSNCGVFVIDIDDIDDSSKALSKIPFVSIGYALYNIFGVLLYTDYHQKTYYSTDEGNTWKFLCEGGGRKSRVRGSDANGTRYYFDDNVVIEKLI